MSEKLSHLTCETYISFVFNWLQILTCKVEFSPLMSYDNEKAQGKAQCKFCIICVNRWLYCAFFAAKALLGLKLFVLCFVGLLRGGLVGK